MSEMDTAFDIDAEEILQDGGSSDPSTILTHDGFVVDADTGEILRLARDVVDGGHTDMFEVKDLTSAEWVMELMQNADAEIAKQLAIKQARVDACDGLIRDQVRRRNWLKMRFGPELEKFAAVQLKGAKTQTLKTGFGKLAFRLGQLTVEVLQGQKDAAIAFLEEHLPRAVKVEKSVLVSELKGGDVPLPKELFEVHPAAVGFSVNTGITLPKNKLIAGTDGGDAPEDES